MGRKVEETMLAMAISRACKLGARRLVATYLPTPKNEPCLSFFKRSGMEIVAGRDGEQAIRFVWDTVSPYPMPNHIAVRLDT
jgi:predicted enzyme involved in methoxymalonyl-ACP biosynthesis